MPEQVLSLERFSRTMPQGSPDRIWLGPLRVLHGSEKHTAADWRAIIERLRKTPATR